MKNIKLNVAERLSVSNLLSEIYQAGGLHLGTLKLAFNIVSKIEINEQERKAIDLVQKGGSISWNPKKDKEKEFEFSEDEAKLIKDAVKAKDEKKGFTLADRFILGIAEKFGVELKEDSVNEN